MSRGQFFLREGGGILVILKLWLKKRFVVKTGEIFELLVEIYKEDRVIRFLLRSSSVYLEIEMKLILSTKQTSYEKYVLVMKGLISSLVIHLDKMMKN